MTKPERFVLLFIALAVYVFIVAISPNIALITGFVCTLIIAVHIKEGDKHGPTSH